MGDTVRWTSPPPTTPCAGHHPHLRGEHIGRVIRTVWPGGSPPPTWGALYSGASLLKTARITPTYVGSTKFRSNYGTERWDHPHLRGEHTSGRALLRTTKGSPPPTWGARWGQELPGQLPGITPTYVGSTECWVLYTTQGKDHPHLRGEHYEMRRDLTSLLGSPPPTWGAHSDRGNEAESFGITPTYVGSTQQTLIPNATNWDHPHLRGEHKPASITLANS